MRRLSILALVLCVASCAHGGQRADDLDSLSDEESEQLPSQRYRDGPQRVLTSDELSPPSLHEGQSTSASRQPTENWAQPDTTPPPPRVSRDDRRQPAAGSGGGGRTAKLVWPIRATAISSRFGYRSDPIWNGSRAMHRGVDIRCNVGAAIYSAADGEVVFAGAAGGRGIAIEIWHSSILSTVYAHLSSATVQKGSQVRSGQLIGRAGLTGRTTGPHLHFEVWRKAKPVDPLAFYQDRDRGRAQVSTARPKTPDRDPSALRGDVPANEFVPDIHDLLPGSPDSM